MLQNGESEGLKATVHASLGTLAFLCAAYNLLAWRRRHEPHLLANGILYTALVALEAVHTHHHL